LSFTYLNTVIQLSSLYTLIALAVVISFRFCSFPDLGIEGSFVLGSTVSAILAINNQSLLIIFSASFLAGFLAGFFTSTLNYILKINRFFCGIVTAMILYSINIRILGGANLSIYDTFNIFRIASGADWKKSMICLAILVISIGTMMVFFHTITGLKIRGYGSNSSALIGTRREKYYILMLGLGISNALAAVSGSFIAQYQSFVDVNMGIGVAITGFACLFLGEAVVSTNRRKSGKKLKSIFWSNHDRLSKPVIGEFSAAVIGCYVFFTITTGILYWGLYPSDLKMVSAVILVLAMSLRSKRHSNYLVSPSKYER